MAGERGEAKATVHGDAWRQTKAKRKLAKMWASFSRAKSSVKN